MLDKVIKFLPHLFALHLALSEECESVVKGVDICQRCW